MIELPTTLNLVDALLVLVILLHVWSGWTRGFLQAVMQLLTLAGSLVLAFVGYQHLTSWLEGQAPTLGQWTAPLSFVATYALAHLILGAAAGRLVGALPRAAHGHRINRLSGLLPGFANGLINATVAALLLLTLPLGNRVNDAARDSAIVGRLSGPAEWAEARLAPIFQPAIQRTMQRLTLPAESKSSVALPFRVTTMRPRPDLEAGMLELLNAERAGQGLRPLAADAALAQVARAHSHDMFTRGYFSHVNPEGQEPFDRMRQAQLRFLAAGENLALAQTLPAAHQGLMDSPGHRANILRPQFGRVGIGVLDGGRHGLMVTQKFRN